MSYTVKMTELLSLLHFTWDFFVFLYAILRGDIGLLMYISNQDTFIHLQTLKNEQEILNTVKKCQIVSNQIQIR